MTIQAPDGAYTIGGGAYNFGQTMTEDLARAAFEFPMPTPANMIELLQLALEQLPLDALKPFQDFLGLANSAFSNVAQAVAAIIASLQQRPIFLTMQEFVHAVTGIVNGDWTDFNAWVAKLPSMDAVVAYVTNAIKDFITSNQLTAAIADFVTNNALTVAIRDFITNNQMVQAVAKAIADIVQAITGTAGQGVAFLTTWFATNIKNVIDTLGSNIQALINGIISAFGGVGTTVANAVSAINTWLTTGPFGQVWKFFTDLFAKINEGLTSSVATVGNIFTDALNAITAILGVGNRAGESASQARAEIEKIKSEQAGGYSDDFEITLGTDMPSPAWQRKNTAINDRYAPDGKGSVVGYIDGNGFGLVWYNQTTKQLPTANMKVSWIMSRLPWWDLFVKSGAVLALQGSSTAGDKSGLFAYIDNNVCRFIRKDAAGNDTQIGSNITIPAFQAGVPYEFSFLNGTLTLKINGIQAAQVSGVTALAGRCIGFGGWKVAYTSVNDNPLAHYAGITWAGL